MLDHLWFCFFPNITLNICVGYLKDSLKVLDMNSFILFPSEFLLELASTHCLKPDQAILLSWVYVWQPTYEVTQLPFYTSLSLCLPLALLLSLLLNIKKSISVENLHATKEKKLLRFCCCCCYCCFLASTLSQTSFPETSSRSGSSGCLCLMQV